MATSNHTRISTILTDVILEGCLKSDEGDTLLPWAWKAAAQAS